MKLFLASSVALAIMTGAVLAQAPARPAPAGAKLLPPHRWRTPSAPRPRPPAARRGPSGRSRPMADRGPDGPDGLARPRRRRRRVAPTSTFNAATCGST